MRALLLAVVLTCTGCVGLYGPDVPPPVVIAPAPVVVAPVYVVPPPVYYQPYPYTRPYLLAPVLGGDSP
jgi:hypothetical protein